MMDEEIHAVSPMDAMTKYVIRDSRQNIYELKGPSRLLVQESIHFSIRLDVRHNPLCLGAVEKASLGEHLGQIMVVCYEGVQSLHRTVLHMFYNCLQKLKPDIGTRGTKEVNHIGILIDHRKNHKGS